LRKKKPDPAAVSDNIANVGWILLARAVLHGQLSKNEEAAVAIHRGGQFGYIAFAVYSTCAVAAFWFPLSIVVITTLIWILCLIWGINMKHE